MSTYPREVSITVTHHLQAILVILNLAGVLIVSQFSTKLTGAVLAQVLFENIPENNAKIQISAIAYAIYLVMYARFMDRYGEIDMNLMFGKTLSVIPLTLIAQHLLFLRGRFAPSCHFHPFGQRPVVLLPCHPGTMAVRRLPFGGRPPCRRFGAKSNWHKCQRV